MEQEDKLKVLMIDDSPLIRERLKRMLTEVDNVEEVMEAADYEEAFELLQVKKVDLLLLDLGLPGKSGLEVLKELRRNGWPITVIVLTNQTHHFYRQLCLSLGAHYFLDKSADCDKLPELILRLKKKDG